MKLNSIIGRAFAQGVSDHRHCVLFQELAATSPTTSWIQSSNICSNNPNTFFNKCWLTFGSTLTNWTELLSFPATISLFLHRLRFFSQQIQNNAQQLLKQLFLVWKSARGGAFGEPSGLSFVTSRPNLRLGGIFFWDWSPGASFLMKNAFWEPAWLQNGIKIASGSDLWCNFYIFQGTLILNGTPLILVYF